MGKKAKGAEAAKEKEADKEEERDKKKSRASVHKDKAGTKKGDKKSPKGEKAGKIDKDLTSPKSGASGSPKSGRGKSKRDRSSTLEKADDEAEAEAAEAEAGSVSKLQAGVAGLRRSIAAAGVSLATAARASKRSGNKSLEEPGVEVDEPLLPKGAKGADAEGASRRERSSPPAPGMMGRMCGSLGRLRGRSSSAPPKPAQTGGKPAAIEEPAGGEAAEERADAEASEAEASEGRASGDKPAEDAEAEEDGHERAPRQKSFWEKLLPGPKPTKAQLILLNHGQRDARLAAEAEALAAAEAAAAAERAEAEAAEAAAAAALVGDSVSDPGGEEQEAAGADAGALIGEGEEEEAVEADPEEDLPTDRFAAKPEGDEFDAEAEEELGTGEPEGALDASGLLSEEELAAAEALAGDAEDLGEEAAAAEKPDGDLDLDEAERGIGAHEDGEGEAGLVTEEELAAAEGYVGAVDGDEAPEAPAAPGEEAGGTEAASDGDAARPESPGGASVAGAEGADAAAAKPAAGEAVAGVATAVAPVAAAVGDAEVEEEPAGMEEVDEHPRSDDVEVAFNVEEPHPETRLEQAARLLRRAGRAAQATAVFANASYKGTQKSVNRTLRSSRRFARDAVYTEKDGEVVMKTGEEMARDGAAGAAKQARKAGRATVAGAQAGGRAAVQGVRAGVHRAQQVKLPKREEIQPAWVIAAGAYVKLKLRGQKTADGLDDEPDGKVGEEGSDFGAGDEELSQEPSVVTGEASEPITDVEQESTESQKAKKRVKLRLQVRMLEPPKPVWDPELWDDENAIAELHAAALRDDALRVRFLLQGLDTSRCIPADLPNEKGETPAVVAARAGCVVSCAALLDGGANPLGRDKESKNYGDGVWPDEARPEAQGKKPVPNIPNGRTVVYHLQQQKLLNEVLARVFPLTKVRVVCAMAEHLAKHYEMSAMSAAVKQNQPELLKLLLAYASMFPESMQQPPPLEEDTPRSEPPQVPRALVKNSMKDRDGRATALLHTVNMQRWKCADVILDAGVPRATLDTTVDQDGRNALHLACIAGRVALVRRLLQAGAATSLYSKGGRQPIHEAAALGHVEVLQVLIKEGKVNTLARTREVRGARAPGAQEIALIDGNTALQLAQTNGKTAVCDVLQKSAQAAVRRSPAPLTPQAYARRDWEELPSWSLPRTAVSRRPLPSFEGTPSPSSRQSRLAWTEPPLMRGKAVGPIDWGPLAKPPPPSLKGTRAGLRGEVVVVAPPYISSTYNVPVVQA